MAIFIGLLVVATAIGGAAAQILSEMKRSRQAELRARQLAIVALFAPALARVQDDPKALLIWQPLAKTLRAQFPEELTALDAAAGATFPFSKDALADAHAKWTTEWLAWEATHDATYKLKASQAQQELQDNAGSAAARAKLDAIEREKLDTYQRRYEDYIRVAKALQRLAV